MAPDRTAEQPASEEATTFASLLSDLKRHGCTLLLAGPAQHTALSSACRRLLGSPTERRRRLFVLTTDSVDGHLGVRSLGGPEADAARVVSYPSRTRSAGVADAGLSRRVRTQTVDGGLPALLGAVTDAVEAIDAEAGGLEPAELRLCLDSLDPVLAAHDDQDVFRFLHAVTGLVRDHRGMCHVHLPAEVDSPGVDLVAPLCDAIVEVRETDQPQQRWHLPEADLATDWLLL